MMQSLALVGTAAANALLSLKWAAPLVSGPPWSGFWPAPRDCLKKGLLGNWPQCLVHVSGELLRRSAQGCQSVSDNCNYPAELTHAANMAAGAVRQTGLGGQRLA